jgi:TfoX/Sxy family transcriptional regulator of competence genes
VPNDPRVVVKPMFGNLGCFVNGNMFLGLFGADVGVRLPEPERAALVAAGGGPFGPRGRPMGGYVTLPVGLPATAARDWVARALDHVAALPPKKKWG